MHELRTSGIYETCDKKCQNREQIMSKCIRLSLESPANYLYINRLYYAAFGTNAAISKVK